MAQTTLVPEALYPGYFFYSLPKLNCDRRDHIFSTLSNIVAVKVAYRETVFFYVPNPFSCKGLNSLGYFPVFVYYLVI